MLQKRAAATALSAARDFRFARHDVEACPPLEAEERLRHFVAVVGFVRALPGIAMQ